MIVWIKTVLENSWESETSDCETETKKCKSFIKIAIKWPDFFKKYKSFTFILKSSKSANLFLKARLISL